MGGILEHWHVPIPINGQLVTYGYIGDGEGLGEAPTHPAWPQEQGFPIISIDFGAWQVYFYIEGGAMAEHHMSTISSRMLVL